MFGVNVDVTERKRAEAALEQERSFFKTLVQTVPDLIWLKNPEGVYLACNPRFERLYGAREADILGKTDHDFVSRELADFFREKDLVAIAAKQTLLQRRRKQPTPPTVTANWWKSSRRRCSTPRGSSSAYWVSVVTSPPLAGPKRHCGRAKRCTVRCSIIC